MKEKKMAVLPFLFIILSLALYRVLPYPIAGFSPLVSCSLFSAALMGNKKLALALPLAALLVSDLLFQGLYAAHLSTKQGFYKGQLVNYLLMIILALMGSRIVKLKLKTVLVYSVSGSVFYFLLSNFSVWATHTGFVRPVTFEGLLQCYHDALLFYRDYGLIPGFYGNFIVGDVLWSLTALTAYLLSAAGAGFRVTTVNEHTKTID